MRMNGAQAVIECLKKENVDLVFGYPGGAVLTLYDALYQSSLRHILTKHEQGAVHAADGYARSTGKVGVCFATSGPGAANLVTGIATANIDSIPLVCITGQVATHLIGRDAFQEADVCGITAPVTKHNYLIKKVEDLPRVFKEAFYIASSGRPGPVVIDIAKNVFEAEIDFSYPTEVNLPGYHPKKEGNTHDIDDLIIAMQEAEKPVIFVGGGVILSDTAPYIRQIAEATGIPVVESLMGRGSLPCDMPESLGMVGMHGTYFANTAVMESDLLIGIGARFDDRVTSKTSDFAPNAKIAHFDIDSAEINKNVMVDYPVVGDLRWSLPLFAAKLSVIGNKLKKLYQPWRDYIFDVKKNNPLLFRKNSEYIMPEEVITAVSDVSDENTIIVTDVGQHQMWAAQYYNFQKARTLITSGGLGTMGFGLPAAIGAKLANPDKKVVLFTGDGSIMMNCQEFATLADNDLDIKVVVLNNHMLGMVAQWQRMFYNRHYAHSILRGKTDLVKLAEAMGVKGYRLDNKAAFNEHFAEILKSEGAALIDVLIPDEENVFPMVPAGGRLDQMVLEAEQ
ncbi:acetolactate synthase, large subunit, biosynthetic type [Megamonas hypermegale]|uniref:biosynthetic-type acetolactate synthase large subunit n=1 Tax=Megamonas hypermegale TaxID=158847 RepID=UPI000B37B780|nr:biosynthetic-type acetolactate synthase large subunit [Megamonas hypermegale]OUO41480.1 acetolactate synthase, large subunit, biosynthetic type [Megamonas hypermegale]